MLKEINFLILVLLASAFALLILYGFNSLLPGYKNYLTPIAMVICFVFGIRLRNVCERMNFKKGILSITDAFDAFKMVFANKQ